ncbi:MAG: sigma-70 family RNA polymerase sigma factor [Zhengella sp.]|uniref:sigma-70 family RNA polymerase sigma factor n=1 Tax=Zhengella sp. TaxID=2282762 RepID=UPI001DCCBC2B|nr:sigma-70 family RNA polymerase sigma factor [Notoacmeibacter sp.]MCC0025551.1 sigma-70 family RNA polymerase sigma factor [Brucellaceae bacterium]
MGGLEDDISELIVRTGLKDRSAFDRLYAATSAKLFGICLRVLHDRGEAEDALQDVYVRIWTKADRFAVSAHSPVSWLAAIARNHCIDRLRARKAPARPVEEAFDLADDAPGPERLAVSSSEGRRIDACMEELESARADAVRSAYVMGHSYEELSQRHGVPLNTMRTWLRRSLMKLKECLER